MENLKLFAVYRMDNHCPEPVIVKAETKEEAKAKCNILLQLLNGKGGEWKAHPLWAYQEDSDIFYIAKL